MRISGKYIWNILLIVCVTIIAMYFALRDHFTEIVKAIQSMNIFFLLIVLSWGLMVTVVWGISYQVLGKKYRKKYSFLEGITVAFVGTFFAGITPSSTGGQFGQIYVLKKQGISYSDGASLLWADFIMYQTALMLYVTVLFIARFSHYANMSGWFWFVFFGYIINLAVILGLYTMVLFPKPYIRLAGWLVKVLGRMHILKNPEKQLVVWTEQMDHFTVEIKELSRDKKTILRCLLINFLRLSLYFSLPFVISVGLGIRLPMADLIDTMALASFVSMANAFVPLPGASGGTEVFFTQLFQNLLGALTGAVLLLWRVSTYYIPMITGAVWFVVFKSVTAGKEMHVTAQPLADHTPHPVQHLSSGKQTEAPQEQDAQKE